MPPPRLLHVVFDTNAIFTPSVHYFLSSEASRVIKALSGKASLLIRWYIPPVVKSEREYQMIKNAKDLLPSLRKMDRLMGTSFAIAEDAIRQRVTQIVEGTIKEHHIEVPEFDATVANWNDIINRAAYRLPPFESGTDEEKGFRDAIVMETFCQLHKRLGLSAPDLLILVTDDVLLTTAVTERLGSCPEVVLHRSIKTLETSLVLSAELDQVAAQELVRKADTFLRASVTVGSFSGLLFSRYGSQLRAGPTGGDTVARWSVTIGETALVDKQNSSLKFQTAVLVTAEGTRPGRVVPFVNGTIQTTIWPSGSQTPFVTYPSDANFSVTASAGLAPAISNATVSAVAPTTIYATTGPSTVKYVGRHRLTLTWSAKLNNQEELTEFALGDLEYEDVTWE
jgi:hypothetical protein